MLGDAPAWVSVMSGVLARVPRDVWDFMIIQMHPCGVAVVDISWT